jgi:uncharacterized protein with HEPN domain
MIRDIKMYLGDILENIKTAEDFVEGMSYEEFISDKKTHFAVIRCLEVMGEAIKQIPGELREKHPGIPWKDIAGMRDKLIHFYFGIRLEKVWETVKKEIPPLKPLFEKILKELKG